MTALLLMAVLAPDAAMDAYTLCARTAVASAPLDAVYARVEGECAAQRAAVLESAPDKDEADRWLYVAATLAVAGRGAEPAPDEAKAVATPAAPRYPKLDVYRLCGVENAARTEAERPYMAAAAIATEATARCEKQLKDAAEETATEMRQPGLRGQVMLDFRRRSVADLTQKIGALRAEKGAGK